MDKPRFTSQFWEEFFDDWQSHLRNHSIMKYVLLVLNLFQDKRLTKHLSTGFTDKMFYMMLRSLGMSLVSFSVNFAQISLYKNINYSGSLLKNLNNTMQTKQNATKKNPLIFKYKQDILGTTFCGGRIFSRKCWKFCFFINSKRWNCIENISISKGAVFLMC